MRREQRALILEGCFMTQDGLTHIINLHIFLCLLKKKGTKDEENLDDDYMNGV